MAYEGLRQLGSEVRAPAVFYAQMIQTDPPVTYIVMEYIQGKTAGQCLREAQDDQAEELLSRAVSLAISELFRIPIPPGTRPAAISGETIKYDPVWEFGAPLHYENVQQMEDHFNEVCFPNIAPVPRDLHRVVLTQDGHNGFLRQETGLSVFGTSPRRPLSFVSQTCSLTTSSSASPTTSLPLTSPKPASCPPA